MKKIWNVVVTINCECNTETKVVFSSVSQSMAMVKYNELKIDLKQQVEKEWGKDLEFTEYNNNYCCVYRNLDRDLYDSGEFIEIMCIEGSLDNQKDFEKKFNFFE